MWRREKLTEIKKARKQELPGYNTYFPNRVFNRQCPAIFYLFLYQFPLDIKENTALISRNHT
jgi:hypothetical protein